MTLTVKEVSGFSVQAIGRFQVSVFRFQCTRLRLKIFDAASSVPRCRFASTGFSFFFAFLTPDTCILNRNG
jgi:hypothetical protein